MALLASCTYGHSIDGGGNQNDTNDLGPQDARNIGLPDCTIFFVGGDPLISKHHWGAFAQTALERELRSRGFGTVVLAGIATNMGVESLLCDKVRG